MNATDLDAAPEVEILMTLSDEYIRPTHIKTVQMNTAFKERGKVERHLLSSKYGNITWV